MGSSPSTIPPPDSGENPGTGSDEYKTTIKQKQYEFVCTTCARNGKNAEASTLCKACRDFLCFKCLQWHFKFRADHIDDMVGQDEMRKLGVQGPPVMPTENCRAHDGESWNMFCQKDGVAGCQQCMAQDHRSCESVIPRSSLQIEATIKQMKKTSLHNESTDNTKAPQNEGQVLPKPKSDGEVGGKMRENSDRQVGGKIRQSFRGIDDGQVDGRKIGPSKNMDELQVSGQIKKREQNQNNDQIGGSKKHIKDSTQGRRSLTGDDQVPGSSNQHPSLYTVGSSREVNVRLQSDEEECGIWDMCLLSDGRILMSDFNNDKLKLLDSNLNMTHHCKLSDYPYSVCTINDTEAAVATIGHTIQFVSVEDKIDIGRTINLDHDCCGIVYSNGELCVSDGDTTIHVYTLKGQKLRTIRTSLNDDPTLQTECLTVSNDGSRLYMTNWEYGIVCLDRLSGKVLWKVKDTDDNGYRGVCVDRYNNVFVCRWMNVDVVQFSPDGQLAGVIINESDELRSICIDEVRGRLIVGMFNNDVVKVFDLIQK